MGFKLAPPATLFDPPTIPKMALEIAFEGLVAAAFGPTDAPKVLEWLVAESILASEDFGMLASEEKEVEASIIAPAKAKGVHSDALKHKIAFKKLWKMCRVEQDLGTGLADPVDQANGSVSSMCERRSPTHTLFVQPSPHATSSVGGTEGGASVG